MVAWSDAILHRVHLYVADIYPNGATIDERRVDAFSGIEMGEAIALACAAYDVSFTATDRFLLAILRRDGVRVDVDAAPRGSVLVLADGRLAMTAGRRTTVESSGDVLSIVTEPEPGRYVEAWQLPGVQYPKGH